MNFRCGTEIEEDMLQWREQKGVYDVGGGVRRGEDERGGDGSLRTYYNAIVYDAYIMGHHAT